MQIHFPFDREPRPVELLRDRRGVYGIGVSKSFVDAVRHRLEHEELEHEERLPDALILRPDQLADTKPSGAVLQRITGGFRHGMFSHTAEERLRQCIHHEALRRAGLCWPPRGPCPTDPAWWSEDKKQQARNRGIYHGLRLGSLQVINNLIGKALKEAADADAIKAARRFSFKHRENIYRASAGSRRALQLADTFPFLALAIYSAEHQHLTTHTDFSDFSSWESEGAKIAARKKAAADLVERGARLRDVAAALDVPMVLRAIKPGAAHLASATVCQHPELMHLMPESLPRMRTWLRLVNWANRNVSADYAIWVARNVPQIPGRLEQIYYRLSDLADWVRACTTAETLPEVRGKQFDVRPFTLPEMRAKLFVVRPFTPSMSLKTVTKLSADWHEAVANNMEGPQFAFPAPWYPAAKIGAFEILPIDNSAELYREGAAMHHCVGTYGDKCGTIYVYSIHRDGERLATLELGRNGTRAAVAQLRGPCNAQPPKEITAIVQRWLRAQPPLPQQDPPRQNHEALRAKYEAEQFGEADGIPF